MQTVSWKKRLLLAASIGFAVCAQPAFAQAPGAVLPVPNSVKVVLRPDLKTNMFDYEYVEPKNPAHRIIYNMVKDMRLLEKFQDFLSPIRLPERIKLKIEGCDGVANAFFFGNDVKVCYEYFEYIWKYTPKMARQGLSPKDAMIGPMVDVFLHEVGHAVVEILDVPFFGREEDVADYFATYILLEFCKDDARRLILGASFISGNEAMEEQKKAPELHAVADTHSLPAVRYFNRWCMAYGADPALFADAIDMGMLPENRSKRCRYEFQTNDYAFKTLIAPYIDETLKKKVTSHNWFMFESTAMAAKMSIPTRVMTAEEKKLPKAIR